MTAIFHFFYFFMKEEKNLFWLDPGDEDYDYDDDDDDSDDDDDENEE